MRRHPSTPANVNSNPIAYSVLDAAAASGLSRSFLYNAMKNGELPAKKIGSRTLILRDDLERG
jgi:excisionase family DNA binding protein